MDTSIDELMKDFRQIVSKIDFTNYNPASSEFMTSLFIGLMWKVLSDMNEEKETMTMEDEEPEDEIGGELCGAKKYFQKYLDTSDAVYKDMANDEARHASILIRKMYSKLPSNEMKDKLKNYETQLKQVSEQIQYN